MKKLLILTLLLVSMLHGSIDCTKASNTQEFVKRFYDVILHREADNAGMDDWTNKLLSRSKTGADIAQGFIFSAEYDIGNKSNTQYVNDLYSAFFNRTADTAGFNGWISQLSSGTSREDVLHGFLYSQEFINLANSYGIQAYPGAAFQSDEIDNFVKRFYQVILGRPADSAGLADWTNRLSTATSTGSNIAKGFIFSVEYNINSKSNTQYLNDLYSAFFNRAADTAGFNDWMSQLNSGTSRADVLDGFLGSQEFINLTNSYGILAFTGAPTPPTTNTPPVANAGVDHSITQGDTLLLDGRGSSDNDGSIVCYWWKSVFGTLSTIATYTDNATPLGTNKATLTVVDNKGASHSDSVVVVVHEKVVFPDAIKPIITLIGDANITIEVGSTYIDLGASAIDNIDGNITQNIVVSNMVDTAVEGIYTIIYNVADQAGNMAQTVTRTVHVVPVPDSYVDLGDNTPKYYSNNKAGDQKYIAYYPENAITPDMPVVIFIKGGGSATIESYSGIMQFLASKGYFVIGVDANSYESWYITGKLEIALNEMKASYGLNVSKLAIMGHSLGGGQAFYAMKKFRDDGYGNAGSLALSIDGWFAFNMDEVDLNLLDTKVSFLQMNGVHGTGTDPRIHLKIWNLSTQAEKSFYTLPSTNHSYVAGDFPNVLAKQDLLFTIGALTDDAFRGVNEGASAIPQENKASYNDIFNALQAEGAYNSGDCAGIQYNAINVIQHNDIDYCDLTETVKKYPALTTLTERATDNSVARPTLGNPTIDPVYNTVIKMVDKPDQYTSSYPKVQNWNADMRLMRIGNRIYDAKTLTESNITKTKTSTEGYNILCSRASDYFRWSNKVSNKFYVLNSSYAFIQGKIMGNDVNCSKVLDSFSEYELVHMGPHEGNIDYDDKYVVFVAKKPNDTTFYVILYDIQNKTRVWTKTMPSQNWEWVTVNGSSFWKPTTLDWLSVSPSGKYIVFNNDNAAASNYTDGMYRYDINLTNRVKLQYSYSGNLYSEGGHGDIGYDTDGNEVFVQFLSGLGVYSFNLDNPTELGKKLLGSPYGGGHISCRNTRRPGWCYITANTDSNGNGLKRVFALKLDGTGDENVQNFSQTHIDLGYPTAYGSPSPDGTQVIFNSHWGTGTVGTFVSEAQ